MRAGLYGWIQQGFSFINCENCYKELYPDRDESVKIEWGGNSFFLCKECLHKFIDVNRLYLVSIKFEGLECDDCMVGNTVLSSNNKEKNVIK